MQFNYKNINVNYTSEGKGSVVVLLHGFLENRTMWKGVSAVLATKHRVIAIDLLGHGKTDCLGYIHTMVDQAEMVKSLLNNLRLKKYSIIGHSMGGYIALAFAKLYPKNLRSICLMNSSALPDSDEKKINRDRAIKAVKQSRKTFIRIAIPNLFAEKNRPLFIDEIKQVTDEALKISVQGIVAALEGMKVRKDSTSIYKNTCFPIKMVIGKQDPALEYSSLINQIKNTAVEKTEFPDGHMSHIENKILLEQTLFEFVKKHNK